jgi:hypothetical protein
MWGTDLAFRWVDVSCPPGTVYGCWGLLVVSRDGCRYQEYVSVDILDGAGKTIGNSYELRGKQRAGTRAKYLLPDTTFGGAGKSATVSQIMCS